MSLEDWRILETYIDYPRCAREEEPLDEELRLVEAQEDAGRWCPMFGGKVFATRGWAECYAAIFNCGSSTEYRAFPVA